MKKPLQKLWQQLLLKERQSRWRMGERNVLFSLGNDCKKMLTCHRSNKPNALILLVNKCNLIVATLPSILETRDRDGGVVREAVTRIIPTLIYKVETHVCIQIVFLLYDRLHINYNLLEPVIISLVLMI